MQCMRHTLHIRVHTVEGMRFLYILCRFSALLDFLKPSSSWL